MERKAGYLHVMESVQLQSCAVREQQPIRESRDSSAWFEAESAGPEVLVVHEDSPSESRAREVLKNMESWLGATTCFMVNLCKFGALQDAELAEPALQQAKRADIVFLSLRGDRKLPLAVRNWLLRWLQARDFKPCALVVSLNSSKQVSVKSNSTLNFLRDITAPLEVDLFLHLGWSPLMARGRTLLINRHIPVGRLGFRNSN